MDWMQALQTVGVIVGAAYSVSRIKKSWRNPRTDLKRDLEVMRLLDSTDSGYADVRSAVDRQVRLLYSSKRSGGLRVNSVGGFLQGMFFFLGFTAWTVHLLRDGFTAWALITGYIAFAGVEGIIEAFSAQRASSDQDKKKA